VPELENRIKTFTFKGKNELYPMRTILSKTVISFVLVVIWSCGQKSNDEHHDHDGHEMEEGGNQALYDEVMKVHDEVMPKMDNIYKLKGKLKEKIDNTPDLAADKKKEIEGIILRLDSASEGMMVWMRKFNPLPDSLGEEQAKEYLEGEMEKIKKVKEDVRKVLEEAEGVQ
jgi:archaellum component FlaC